MARFSDVKWAQSDLNRRPPGYQPGAPAKLSYGPRRQEIRRHLSLSGQINVAVRSRELDQIAELDFRYRSSADNG
jgi:hypothetical protein